MPAYTDTQMGTKTISIMDDVYDLLKKQKREHESFSDIIRRSIKKKGDIKEVIGLWSDLSDEDFHDVEKTITAL